MSGDENAAPSPPSVVVSDVDVERSDDLKADIFDLKHESSIFRSFIPAYRVG